jgi:hypothetical protein
MAPWLALFAFTAAVQAQAGAGGSAGGSAMLRFGCSNIVIDRIDPYVGPVLLDCQGIWPSNSPLASSTLAKYPPRMCIKSLEV